MGIRPTMGLNIVPGNGCISARLIKVINTVMKLVAWVTDMRTVMKLTTKTGKN
jgi:hypothetical protein